MIRYDYGKKVGNMMILEEFDSNEIAVINPSDINETLQNFPETVVACFSRVTFDRITANFQCFELVRTSMANVDIPVYEIEYEGERLAIFNAPVGAPACVAIVEDMIIYGMKRLVVFGTCGIFDAEIAESSIIIPYQAIRDEGTSYHYMSSSREISLDKDTQDLLSDFLSANNISYQIGKVWTTDSIYRETKDKLAKRKEEGAICVDMECSALAALAAFRRVKICHFFYAADHLSEEKWDSRSLSNYAHLDEKDKVAGLALAFAKYFHQYDNNEEKNYSI